ncbi:MAG: VaFE repeat-containing surface-anchored protein [Actinomycetaceae bacterium]|nr:VaFE repeat-containing surface-anchored protein [Actinomycetaceae bacterium]
MKVTPASVKIRRWFVAGVAAVMAIAWTVSSLVTPGSADVSGNSVPGQNAAIGIPTTSGGTSKPTHFTAKNTKAPRELISIGSPGLELANYSVRLHRENGTLYPQTEGIAGTELTGNDGQKYAAVCIDNQGSSPEGKWNSGGYTFGDIKDFPRGKEIPGQDRALIAKKFAYLWGPYVSKPTFANYMSIYQKIGVEPHEDSNVAAAAVAFGLHTAFWKISGDVDIDASEVRAKGGPSWIGGTWGPAPRVTPQMRIVANKIWQLTLAAQLPAHMIGAAGGSAGTNIGSAGFDANGNYVVNYEFNGPASLNGKEATLKITTAGKDGLPAGAKLVDNATAKPLKTGDKITLPASVTLTLPATVANSWKLVKIDATVPGNAPVTGTTRIPIDITGTAGQKAAVTVSGLPANGRLETADGKPFTNGSEIELPARIYAIVPSGSQGTLSVQLGKPNGVDTKAAVAVMEQTRSVDTNGDMYVKIGITGFSDSGKAILNYSGLPAGATLTDDATGVTAGGEVTLPATLTLKIPAGADAGQVSISASTSAKTDSIQGSIVRPSHPTSQWLVILNGQPGGQSNASATINVVWSPRPTPPEMGSFTLTKKVTGTDNLTKDFTFDVSCKDGDSQPEVKTVTVKSGQSVTIGEYPEGTLCTIIEDEATAKLDGYSFKGVTYSGGNQSDSRVVKITGKSQPAVTVTATNNYEKPKPKEGIFTVTKVVKGTDEPVANGYSFTVSCNGQSDQTFTLTNGQSKQIGPLPVDTECSVNESTTNTAVKGYEYAGVTFAGGNLAANKVKVTDASSPAITVTATNTYTKPKQGTFVITKDYAAGSADPGADKTFTFNATCTKGDVVKTETLVASKNKPAVSQSYDVGTTCVVEESGAAADDVTGMKLTGATFETASGQTVGGQFPNPTVSFTIKEGEQAVAVQAINKYDVTKGKFQVKKVVEGGPGTVNNNFSFTATCDDGSAAVTKTAKKDGTVEFGPYNYGTTCTVSEQPDSAAIPGYTFNGVTYAGGNVPGSPEKVQVKDDSSPVVTVTATNRYQRKTGEVKISKVVEGASAAGKTFNFTAVCQDGDAAPVTKGVSITGGQTASFGTFPVGTQCTITESEAGTDIDDYTYKGVTFSGGHVSADAKSTKVTVEEGSTEVTATATNVYEQDKGSFKIVKKFAAGSSYTGGANNSFEFDVTCAGKPVTGVSIVDAGEWTSTEYPVGTTCTVAEKTASSKVAGHSFKGVNLTSTAGAVSNNKATFTITKGTAAVTVTATNDYVKPTMKTNASIQGDNELVKGKATQLKDRITFTGLEKGKTYTAGGYFIDKATGKAVTGFYTKKFTTADLKGVTEANGVVNGYIDLTDPKWTVTPDSNVGVSYVAFEYLWEGELPAMPEVPTPPGTDKVTPKPDVEHENPGDGNQTVTSNKKGSFTIEKKVVGPSAGKVPADAVFPFTVDCGAPRVENVSTGKAFTSAELPEGTQCTITENDAPAHFEGATFSKVAFTLNGKVVTGDSVTFTIKAGDKPAVAVVAENSYDTPGVTTDAEPEVPAQEGKPVTVTDKVSYTNLIAGKTYTVEGQLHYQNGDAPNATDGGVVKGVQPGEGFQVGSKPDSVATTFTAPGKEGELVSGTIDLVFVVPAEAVQSKPMVVFEDVYYEGKKVAGHHDINDDKQTIPVDEKIEFPVKKLLAGDGAAQANGTYNFVANCAKPGQTGDDQKLTATVTDGKAAVSKQKVTTYVGETCTIKELAPAVNDAVTSKVNFDAAGIDGVTGGETLTVKVTKANKDKLKATDFAFAATNTVTVNKATFTVKKAAATATGNVDLAGKQYSFEYKCSDDAQWITLGSVAAKGTPLAGPDKPINTKCMVREVNASIKNAELKTAWTVNNQPVTANAAGEVAFTVGAKDSVVAIAATNDYTEKTGKFTLAKKLSTGVTTTQLQDTNFALKYTCTQEGKVVKTGTQEVKANGGAVEVAGVPLGASCVVEEINQPETANATHLLSWTVDGTTNVANKASFAIDSQSVAVNVTANNTYVDEKPGFSVSKQVDSDAIDLDPAAKFTFDYTCKDSVTTEVLTGNFTIDQQSTWHSGNEEKLKNLNVNSECTLTEKKPDSVTNATWEGVHFKDLTNPDNPQLTTDVANHRVTFTVPAGKTALAIQAVNRFTQDRGIIKVSKVLAGDAKDMLNDPKNFTFAMACTYNGKAIDVKENNTVTAGGEDAVWDNLPVGAKCTISELAPTQVDNATHALTWSVNGEDKGEADSVEVTVGAGDASTVKVSATNTYTNNPAAFTVKKESAVATPAGVDLKIPQEFSFEYRCGDATVFTPIGTTVTAGGQEVRVDGLKPHQQCELREESDGFDSRIVKWTVNGSETSVEGQSVTFTPTPGATVAIVVNNEYPTQPKIGTTLTDQAGKHDVSADGKSVVLKDVVKYYNLDTTKTYQAEGKLMAWDEQGSVIDTGITAASAAFIPTAPNGEVIVEFTVPTAELDKFAKVVAFEKLTTGGEVVATHEEPEDDNQIVKVLPKIGTTLTGEDGQAKTYDRPVNPDTTVKLVDVVKYTNARVGKTYRVSGELYGDKGLTGVKAISNAFTVEAPEGHPKAEFATGTVKVVFEVPGSVLQGNKKLVAFEQLWDEESLNPVKPGDKDVTPKNPNDKPTATHEDPKDADQTMRQNPSIGTYATLKNNEGKEARVKTVRLTGEPNQTEIITDKLSWYNLPIGDYVAFGTFIDTQTNAPLDPAETYNGSQKFTVTNDTRDGVVEVPLTLKLKGDDAATANLDIVLFEEVYKASDVENGQPKEGVRPVGVHKDTSDANQKIRMTVEPPLPPEGKLTLKKTVVDSAEEKLPADTLYGFEFSCADDTKNVTRFVLKAEETASEVFPSNFMGKQCTITEVGPVQAEYTEATGWQPLDLGEGKKWNAVAWKVNGKSVDKVVEAGKADKKPANTSYTFNVPVEGQGAEINFALEATNYFVPVTPPGTPGITTDAKDMADGDRVVDATADAKIADVVTYKNLKPLTEYTVKGELHKKLDGTDGGVITSAVAGEGCLVDGAKVDDVDCKDEGNGVVSLTFTTPAAPQGKLRVDGTVELHFVVPVSELKQTTQIVVFETAYEQGIEIAKHHDIDDVKQTVDIPKIPETPEKPSITTDAKDMADGDRVVAPTADAKIADVVTYKNLKPLTEYTVKGELHKKVDGVDAGVITAAKAGDSCLVDGATVEGVDCKDEGDGIVSLTFTTPAAPEGQNRVNGTVELHFVVPVAEVQQNKYIVVFETAYEQGIEIAKHHDIDDGKQTVEIPKIPPSTPEEPGISTNATDATDGDKEVSAADAAEVADLVIYSNLKPETQYTMKGELHKKVNGKDGGVLKDVKASTGCLVDGAKVDGVDCKDEGNGVVSLTFTTPAAPEGQDRVNGNVTLKFLVPQADLQKTEHIVAFETAYEKDTEIAKHHDIDDDAQTVKVKPEPKKPTLKTSATEKIPSPNVEGPDRVVRSGSDANIMDEVMFTNLQVGKTYTIKGELHKKVNGADGGIVSNVVAGKDCSVQVEGGTDAVDLECKNEGNGIVSVTFSPSGEADSYVNGSVFMDFVVPAKAVTRNSQFVVFERAYLGEQEVATHANINDEAQTVIAKDECPPPPEGPDNPPNTPDLPPEHPYVPPTTPDEPNKPGNPDNCPEIGTVLKVKTDKGTSGIAYRGSDQVVVDTIRYNDLLPHTEYTMLGRLHKDSDAGASGVISTAKVGNTCTVDGKKVECKDGLNGFIEVTFTTGEGNNDKGYVDGEVSMEWTVPKDALAKMKKVVAFETLFDKDGYMIAWHHDINSEPQTVTVKIPKTPPTTPPGETPPGPTPPGVTPPPSTPFIPTLLSKTGATTFTLIALGLMALVAGGMLVWASPSRRRDTQK